MAGPFFMKGHSTILNVDGNWLLFVIRRRIIQNIMGNCIYCGKKVGFLKSIHREYEADYHNGKQKIVNIIASTITESSDFINLENDVKAISESSFVKPDDIMNLYSKGFDKAINLMLEDGIITPIEEEKF